MKRRTKAKPTDLLSQIKLFAGCTDKELSGIARLMTEVSVPAGRVLCREGEAGSEAFVIASGEADVALKGKTLATLGPGEVVGEMAVIDHAPRSATVTAKTDLDLYVLEGREFWTMVSDNPLIARKLLKNLAQRLREVEGAPTH
jgi:CRP-like cAMP-binding protein